jgi:hypothetical protein
MSMQDFFGGRGMEVRALGELRVNVTLWPHAENTSHSEEIT